MQDKEILLKIIKLSNLEQFTKDLLTSYKMSIKYFLEKVIKYKKDEGKLFKQYYQEQLTINQICEKTKKSRFEIREIFKDVLNIDLYLSLSKAKLNFKDPLYEYHEFNKLLKETIGLDYEPIRLELNRKYKLIEREKNKSIYILLEEKIFIQDSHTINVLSKHKKNSIDFKMVAQTLLKNYAEVKINDINFMKKYLKDDFSNINTKDYQKIYKEIKNYGYANGYYTFISRSRAMQTREWTIAHLKGELNTKLPINIVLFNSIREKIKINEK